MSRHADSLTPDYFAGLYVGNLDPWRLTSSSYERDKYAATLASLPRDRYASALEIGCAIGVFTHALSDRCDAVTALDVVPDVLAAARERCADRPGVRFLQAAVPDDWPDGRFDLMVISEVAYFLDRADIARLVARIEDALEPGGDVILVHWIGETDYPLSGDEAAEALIADAAFLRPMRQDRTDAYRLDVLRRADAVETLPA